MIKSIMSYGKYITVTGGLPPTSNYVNNFSGAQGLGNVRFNTVSQALEIWDGNTWMLLASSYASVGLNQEAEELLDWAKRKRDQELHIEQLAAQHPGIRDLKEKLDIMLALVDKDTV